MRRVITSTVPLNYELVSLTPSDCSDHYFVKGFRAVWSVEVLTRASGAGTVKILNLHLLSDADYAGTGDQRYAANCG